MVRETGKYTVITGASSGIGYETAKAFVKRGKNLVITARRKDRLEMLKQVILGIHPDLDIVIRNADLSVSENVYQLYERKCLKLKNEDILQDAGKNER